MPLGAFPRADMVAVVHALFGMPRVRVQAQSLLPTSTNPKSKDNVTGVTMTRSEDLFAQAQQYIPEA